MIAVPAWVWRGGPVQRVVSVGIPVGTLVGALAYADSGMAVAGVVVFVVIGIGCGVVTARRMARYWPGAQKLSGADRFTVVRATRRGDQVAEARLVPSVIDYRDGLSRAREGSLRFRWLLWLLVAASLALAVIDSFTEPFPSAAVSWAYVGFFAVELFWWPGRQAQLVANADRAVDLARRTGDQNG